MRASRSIDVINLVALVVLLLVFSGVVWSTYSDLEAIDDAERVRVDGAFDLTVERISAHLELLRSRVETLAWRESELIGQILRDPAAYEAATRLNQKAREAMPLAFGATVATVEGETVIPDFDGHVGEVCSENIQRFAKTGGKYQIRVHPNPLGYHFDIMVPFDDGTGWQGIFFVSFRLDELAAVLDNGRLDGHELMLLLDSEPDLIEVTHQGSRMEMDRAFRLETDALDRMMRVETIPGTMWRLADLPRSDIWQERKSELLIQRAGYLGVALLLVGYVLMVMRSEYHQRRRLKLANRTLETRVRERTAELAAANQRIRATFENASDAIVTIDSRQQIREFNPGAEVMFGYTAAEVIGKPLSILLPERARAMHGEHIENFEKEELIARAKHSRSEIHGVRKDGSEFVAEASICKLALDDGMFFTAFVRDVSERKVAEQRMRELAETDSLTGIANRRHFLNRLSDALRYGARFGQNVGVVLLDLDDFKPVNDTHGHHVGDQLLKEIAGRLTDSTREVDTCGRLGGDEFALVLSGVADTGALERVLEKLQGQFGSVEIEGMQLEIHASIGAALYPLHGEEPEVLIQRADAALYRAKAAGRNRYAVYDERESGDSAGSGSPT